MPQPMQLVIDAADPYRRGVQRGNQVTKRLQQTWPTYQRLFARTARDARREAVDVEAIATACLDTLSVWRPELLRELEGVAAGAEVALSTIAAMNARTEVLAQSGNVGQAECSTIVDMAQPVRAAQTWDWYAEFSAGWHLQTVRGDEHTYAGLTEHGILAKIGVNDAGLGVHLNILGHHSDVVGQDGPLASPRGGVPVHLVAQRLLAEVTTVAEAVELVRSAPASASTVLTVVTADDAACLEISPDGVGVVAPYDGWLVHTNHFLDPTLVAGDRQTVALPTTYDREQLLRTRVKGVVAPLDMESLVGLLCAHDEDGVAVCCHPDESLPSTERKATLATVGIDPSRRAIHMSAGGPCRRTAVTTLFANGS